MKKVLMLLSNSFMPDPRPYNEAVSLIGGGYSVDILCWDRGEGVPAQETISGIKVKRIRLRSEHGRGTLQAFFLMGFWLKMLPYLLREDYDIILSHDLDTLPVGLFARALRGKKIVFDSHEIYSKMLGGNIARPIKKIVSFLEKTLVKLADRVIVTNQDMIEYYTSLGVKNISIIGNWKDPKNFKFDQEVINKEKGSLGISDELVISYIANLGSERMISPLLEVAAEDKDIFLVIGGDGAQRRVVEDAVKLSRNIRYLGFVSYEKVPLYTAVSDVVYYGYDRNAGMAQFNSPNKLFESLAAGKAFLGGDFGEMGRIIKNEECGIALHDFSKDEIKRAINIFKDKNRLERYKRNAYNACMNKYNWLNVERELLSIFKKLNKTG